MVWLKTLVFTLIVPGTVAVYVPWWIAFVRGQRSTWDLGGIRFLGVPLILAGAAIYLSCARDFTISGRGTPALIDPPKDLVVRGLYRYVRNPMYLGILFLLVGEALLLESGAILKYAAGAGATVCLFVLFYEEPSLRRRFGEAYERYCATVPRWIPRRRTD